MRNEYIVQNTLSDFKKVFYYMLAGVNAINLRWVLTHWGWDNMDAIMQMIFWNAFSGMKMFEFQLQLQFVPSVPIDDAAILVKKMAWCQWGDKSLSEAIMFSFTDPYTALSLDKLMCYSLMSVGNCMLTHWGQDNMATIFQMTFSNAFSWMKYV